MNQPKKDRSSSPLLEGELLPDGASIRNSISGSTFERSSCTELAPQGSEWYVSLDRSLVGLLSNPDLSQFPLPKGRVIIFGGSGGGIEKTLGLHFASRGFTSLALGYHLGGFTGEPGKDLPPDMAHFKVPNSLKGGLAPHLEHINLDNLNKAVD